MGAMHRPLDSEEQPGTMDTVSQMNFQDEWVSLEQQQEAHESCNGERVDVSYFTHAQTEINLIFATESVWNCVIYSLSIKEGRGSFMFGHDE